MRLHLAFLALLFCPAAVGAQSTPQAPPASKPEPAAAAPAVEPPKIDPEKEASIRQLLEVTGALSVFAKLAENESEAQKPMLINALPPGDYRSKLVDLFFERLRSKLTPDLVFELAIPIYDKYFTIDEIKALVQFYQTPLGRKAASILPKATAEMYERGKEIGQTLGRESMMEILTEHPDLREALQAAAASSKRGAGGTSGGPMGGIQSGAGGGLAPPGPEGTNRIRVSTEVQEAKLMNKVIPAYPPLARQARIQGTVKLHAIIGTDGTIEWLEAVEGHPLLIQAAMDAVKQWRYKPTLLEGAPVEVETYIDVIFTLGDKPAQPN